MSHKWYFTAAASLEPSYIGRDGDTHYSIIVPWPELDGRFSERHHAITDAKERRNALAALLVQLLNNASTD